MDAERAPTRTRARIALTVLKTCFAGGGFDRVRDQGIDSVVDERHLGAACARCHYCRPGLRGTRRTAEVGIN